MTEQEKKIAELQIEVAGLTGMFDQLLKLFEKHVKFNYQSHNEIYYSMKENFEWVYKWAKEVSGAINKEDVEKLFASAEKSQKYLM